MPKLHVLAPHETKAYPTLPVWRDESSTASNIAIIEDLYIKQMRVDVNDSAYSRHFRSITGDLKMYKRIEEAIHFRNYNAHNAFNKFDWILPSIGFWHLRFNMLQLIHAIHMEGTSYKDMTSLQYAADRWKRQRVARPNDFQALERLIIQSYATRVVGTWIRHMYRAPEKKSFDRVEETFPWLEAQSFG